MRPIGLHDRLWIWLCGISLIAYLLCSVSVRAFIDEVRRLTGQLF
jgi:hypothetical protein